MHATALTAVGLLMAQLLALPSATVPAGEPTLASPEATEGPATVPGMAADDAVLPVDAEPQRLVPIRPADSGTSPASLVREALERPAGSGVLAGVDVGLFDVLTGTVGRARRTELIRAYWALSAALATYHFALDDERRVSRLADSRPDPPSNDAQLQVALATARVHVEQARLDTVTAQHRLAELQTTPLLASLLPLPADLPHAGPYRTLYEQFFSGQSVPAARRLHDTLAIQYALICARAEAIRASRALLSTAKGDFQSGRTSAATVLACHERLAERQRGFVAAVRDYNVDIAEYAQLVAPENLDAAQLVTMLVTIETKPAPFAPTDHDGLRSVLTRPSATGGVARDTGDRGVVRATAEEPVSEDETQPELDTHAKDRFVPRRPGLEP